MGILDPIKDSLAIIFKKPVPLILLIVFQLAIVLTLVSFVYSAFGLTSMMCAQCVNAPMQPNWTFVILVFLVIVLLSTFIQPLFVGYYVNISNQYYKNKGKILSAKAFDNVKKRYLSVLGAEILVQLIGLAIIAIPLILILLGIRGISSNPSSGSIGSLLMVLAGSVLMIVALAVYVVGFFETYQVIFAEGKTAVAAVKRSFELSKGRFWSIFGLMLVVGLTYTIIIFAVGLLNGLVFSTYPILSQIVPTIIEGGLGAFYFCLPVAFYNYNISKKRSKVSK